jgi:3-oxoacyl-[acyl-carrier-protein] synthase II
MITGLGVVCSLGSGRDAFWRALCGARSTPGRIQDPHGHYAHSVYYTVSAADEPSGPDAVAGIELGRASRFAVEAARQAIADAALGEFVSDRNADRCAVVVGTGMGDAGWHERQRVADEPAARAPTAWGPSPFPLAAAVADDLGSGGPAVVVSNACAASGYAMAIAADLIRAGEADVVIAGGADAYSRIALSCFNRMGAIDPVRCRPFDRHRRGTVFGEGAGMVVLEAEWHAQRRAAAAYGQLASAAWSCEAHHVTAPEPTGAQIRHTMHQALREAGLPADAVGAVVPHGTGTELNDVVESEALGAVLGERSGRTPLYSLKAMVGHTGGAAAALGAVAGSLILRHRTVPPNVAIEAQDPRCPGWLPAGGPVALAGPAVMVNAYAFGGMNVSMLLAQAS